ncbi:MAG: helix-turn-helix domain-containing protein [Verrucomicrobiales bacterium]|nr:helix-turn-helix domain-containing protein [Verrucomicrobiales bacterium]
MKTETENQVRQPELVGVPPDLILGMQRSASGSVADQTDLPRLAYSVAEAAQMLGVCEKTVRRLISRGLLRPSRALRHLLIPKKELEKFLENTLSE